MTGTCLNCDTGLLGKFCHNCGQKASTHRITFGKFISHDLIHGVFHLDKGIFFTLRELILNPGYSARNFLIGKRVQHYNIFALFLIIIVSKAFLDSHAQYDWVISSSQGSDTDQELNKLYDNYFKIFYLLSIPVLSFLTYLFYRKLKFNFTEHIVWNCFILTGGFFYSLIFSLFGYLINNKAFSFFGSAVLLTYILIGYYQFTKSEYTFSAFCWRVMAILLIFGTLILSSFALVYNIFYGGNFTGQMGIQI